LGFSEIIPLAVAFIPYTLLACEPELVTDHAMKQPPFSARVQWATIAALAAPLACLAFDRAAQAGGVAVTCTNPFSGASWQIAIDYDRRTVDSNPARISEAEISWRDAKDGWNYTLNRKSGKLTVILASATGGNFLFDNCDPVK
jgi:hypothetical protein